MRTDKEQFDLVTENYEKREGAVRRRRKIVTVTVAMSLAVMMIVSSVIFLPGLLKRDPEKKPVETVTVNDPETASPAAKDPAVTPDVPLENGGSEYYITDKGKADKLDPFGRTEDPSGLSFDPMEDAEWGAAPAPAVSDRISGYSDAEIKPWKDYFVPGKDDQTVYTAGTLTGAELRDRLYFEDYLKSVKELLEKDDGIKKFDTSAEKRIKVTVKDEGVPQSFVKVDLHVSGREDPVWTALTDNKGEAYLYFNVRADEAQEPSHLTYSTPYGMGSYNLRTGDGYDEYVELQINGKAATKKLDLMFMIDTTGSMGDELEYLKTEIRDIIAKIVGDRNYSVRTSVNFYRDKGDEYIVHATPFTTDPEEVYEYIRKEYSAGGGDFPEAVHTALDNAVNGHEWDEDAVKLCFFVLDAPPHYENQEYGDSVYETLRGAVKTAAAEGIRIIPIVSSGSDSLTEYLMRTYAVMTGGTYTFLTDHSGVGNPHSEPDTDVQYEIEKLNDMIVRIAKEYME